MEAKFDFYEIAVVSSRYRLKKYHGLECVVIGRNQDDRREKWGYAIKVNEKNSWAFEHELKKTGKFANPDDYKYVDTVRVRVLPDGSGELVNEN